MDLKFRFWDTERKKMSDTFDIYEASYCLSDGPEGMTYPKTGVVMQFTGLHDKNGKEIYEGDILKVVTGIPDWPWIYIQILYEVAAGGDQKSPCSGFIAKELTGTRSYIPRRENMEVIGNIYENPELLKTE